MHGRWRTSAIPGRRCRNTRPWYRTTRVRRRGSATACCSSAPATPTRLAGCSMKRLSARACYRTTTSANSANGSAAPGASWPACRQPDPGCMRPPHGETPRRPANMTGMGIRLPLSYDQLPATGALVVGFSGGLDSSALLHALAGEPVARARGLRAVHIHHGLQPGADEWATHCARQAADLDVPLKVIRVQVPLDAGLGPEGAAREARYAALLSALDPGDVLVTAHHQGDEAATFRLRALRASGPEGLGAMRPLRRFGAGWHWRPLLEVPRQRLLGYGRAHGLAWIEDPSNASAEADRNFLRLQLLPLLRQRWPHADAALARSAALSAQADGLLLADEAHWLEQHAGDGGRSLPVA